MSLCLNSLVTRQLRKLSVGLPLTSVRCAAIKKAAGKTDHPFTPGFGERIYLFHHILDGITVYSSMPILVAHKALRQIPFFGKKLKPSKIRRDYWRPLAMIEFPEGYGEVGRSAYQRLRECKSLHELAWGDEMYHDDKTGRLLTRDQRGRRLKDQKPYIIADIAAILGGAGKGNKVRPAYLLGDDDVLRTNEPGEEARVIEMRDGKPYVVDAAAGKIGNVARAEDVVDGLLRATVHWVNEDDRKHARTWPPNVTHEQLEDSGKWPPPRSSGDQHHALPEAPVKEQAEAEAA